MKRARGKTPDEIDNIKRLYLSAVNSKDSFALQELIEKWPEHAKGTNLTGRTLLRTAIRGGSSRIVKLLLENDTSEIDLKDKNGFTPLMAAAVWKNYDIVKLLVEYGADVNIQDNTGNTAIFRAIFTKHDKILELLIKNGADVNIKNASGVSPHMMVKGTEQEDIMKKLLEERE